MVGLSEEQASSVENGRRCVGEIIRGLEEGAAVHVKMRPVGTCRQPPLDTFARKVVKPNAKGEYKTVQALASNTMSREEIRDRLLQVLWDALFLSACEVWSRQKKANTTMSETLELGHWFHKGQQIAKKPLLDGICSMCGCLLHGLTSGNSIGNTCYGPPMNRDGHMLTDVDGMPMTHSQPPFLWKS